MYNNIVNRVDEVWIFDRLNWVTIILIFLEVAILVSIPLFLFLAVLASAFLLYDFIPGLIVVNFLVNIFAISIKFINSVPFAFWFL
jgi:hypothetical protein